MSYSRWITSSWYTFYNASGGDTLDEQQDQKMVPLAAMLATRKKLQEAEMRAQKAEAASQAYQELMRSRAEGAEEAEDDRDSATKVEKTEPPGAEKGGEAREKESRGGPISTGGSIRT